MKTKLLKKLFSVMIAGTVVFSLAACSSRTESESTGSDQTEANAESQQSAEIADTVPEENDEENTGEESGALIVYFSWSGNTEAVAQEIQNQTGADLFEIVPAEPYTDDYDELLDVAQEEQSSDARPAIADTADLSGYDTVYLGFPNWWGDMPMIIYTSPVQLVPTVLTIVRKTSPSLSTLLCTTVFPAPQAVFPAMRYIITIFP
ncbi:MAG: flavodoxin [Ruminococcus sp.]|jgi:uncharacterized lipoprotein YehR (DUF1307 family)